MTVDIATLGVAFDTSGVKKGENDLRTLEGQGKRTADQMDKIGSRSAETSRRLSVVGQGASALKTQLLELAAVVGTALTFEAVINRAVEAQAAFTKLQATVRATGGAAGLSATELADYAEQLQNVTRFSKQTIEAAEATLLTFNKIKGDTFPRVIQLAADLAEQFGGDLSSSAFNLGRALQDPGEGLTALARQGIRLDPVLEATVQRMAQVGDVAGAQAIVLRELEGRVGGVAQAMNTGLAGALANVHKSFQDLLESKDSLDGVTGSMNQLAATLKDPEVIEGLNLIVRGIIKIVELAAEAASKFGELGKSIGETAAQLQSDNFLEKLSAYLAVISFNPITFPLTGSFMDLAKRIRDAHQAYDDMKDSGLDPFNITAQSLGASAAIGEAQSPFRDASVPDPTQLGTKEADQAIADLKKQIALWGELTEVEKVHANVALGIYGKLSSEQEQELVRLARRLDLFAAQKKAEEDALQALRDRADAIADVIREMDDEATRISDLRDIQSDNADLREQIALMKEGMATDQAILQVRTERLAVEAALAEAAGDNIKASLLRAQAEKLVLENQTRLLDPVKQLQDAFDELHDSISAMGESWSHGANQIVDGINKIVKMSTDASKKSASEQASAWAGALGDMADGAASFFDVNSAGYKDMERVSKAFHIVEMALVLERTAAKAMEAIASQAGAGPYIGFALMAAMAAALASYGIKASAGSSTIPSVPQGSVGAGSGTVLGDPMQESESIAHSLDLLTSIADKGLDYSSAQLQALRSIDASLHGIGVSLARNFAVSGSATPFNLGSTFTQHGAGGLDALQRNFLNPDLGNLSLFRGSAATIGHGLSSMNVGAQIVNAVLGGIIGNTTVEQADSGLVFQAGQTLSEAMANGVLASYFATIKQTTSHLFGLGRSESFSDVTTPLEQQLSTELTAVFKGVGDSLIQAVDVLGLDAVAARAQLGGITLGDVGLDKVSLQGLSAQEVQDRLSAVFSAFSDTLAVKLIPAIADFQRVGEGAAETLVRVASETQAITGALRELGIGFGELTGLDLAHAAEGLIDVAGGLDNLASAVGDFYDRFYSDEQKLANETAHLNDVLAQLGLGTLPNTRDGFRELVTGLDLTTEAGRQMFATLIGLAPEAADVYDALEQQVKDTLASLQSAVDQAGQGVINAVHAQQQIIQDQISALQAAKSKWEGIAQSLHSFADNVGDTMHSLLGITQRSMILKGQFNALVARAKLGDQNAAAQLSKTGGDYAQAIIASAHTREEALAGLSDLQQVTIGAASTAERQVKLLQQQIDELQAQSDALDAQLEQLGLINNSVMSVADAIKVLQDAQAALAAAQATATQATTAAITALPQALAVVITGPIISASPVNADPAANEGMRAELQAIAKSTAQMAKILVRVTPDGESLSTSAA